jgi:UDP-N-acetylglucosamine transferase subunit ALG13
MIFVTVGTYRGDILVREMDAIAPALKEEVIIQLGYTPYKPVNCSSFDFAPSLDSYFGKARIVIGHGGLGTIFEILHLGKPFIGVSNSLIPDKHQNELLEKLGAENYILWCKDLKAIGRYVELSKTHQFKKYRTPRFNMDGVIEEFFRI